jgi:hypothetical protein
MTELDLLLDAGRVVARDGRFERPLAGRTTRELYS